MTAVNESLLAPARPMAPVIAGQGPLVIATDGDYLIIKNVTFRNGKRYDVRILSKDADGNVIKVDENSTYSRCAISQIPDIAKRIFHYYRDPLLAKVVYSPFAPETCESVSLSDEEKRTDLTKTHSKMVEGARTIYNLLYPALMTECALDPNVNLLIRPIRERPYVAPKKEAPAEKPIPALQVDPKAVPPSFSDASTETDESSPFKTPATIKREDLVERMEEEGERRAKGFLEGVTYSDLKKYSLTREEGHKLNRVYQAFKTVVQDPEFKKTPETSDLRAMREWITGLYLGAHKHYRNCERDFNEDKEKPQGVQTFEDWCRHYGANSVAAFIKTDLDVDPLVTYLKNKWPLPSDTNIY